MNEKTVFRIDAERCNKGNEILKKLLMHIFQLFDNLIPSQ